MSSTVQNVRNAGIIVGVLGAIGFIGLVWLLIFGNLSGNLGIPSDSANTAVQQLTLRNDSAVTLTGTSGKVNPVVSSVVVINATGGETITSGNYTQSGTTIIGSATTDYNGTLVNVSYTTTYDSYAKVSADMVIGNSTQGIRTFFSFSNTLFTIAAIVLLITLFAGLLYLVITIAEGRGKKQASFTS